MYPVGFLFLFFSHGIMNIFCIKMMFIFERPLPWLYFLGVLDPLLKALQHQKKFIFLSFLPQGYGS